EVVARQLSDDRASVLASETEPECPRRPRATISVGLRLARRERAAVVRRPTHRHASRSASLDVEDSNHERLGQDVARQACLAIAAFIRDGFWLWCGSRVGRTRRDDTEHENEEERTRWAAWAGVAVRHEAHAAVYPRISVARHAFRICHRCHPEPK